MIMFYRIECLADDRYLRFNTVKCLYKLNSIMLWKNVLNIIIKRESLLKDRKFFHNSKAHRIKQRIVQVLLIVACDKHHEVCTCLLTLNYIVILYYLKYIYISF